MTITNAENKQVTIEVDSSARGHLGNVVYAEWDAALGIDVPTQYEAQKGSLLFFNTRDKEPEVVDPVSRAVKKMKDYKMTEAVAVVDVRGGENLAHNDDRQDKLTFSGEMLLFRNDGSLAVSDELDDQDAFRMFTFADEKEQADKSAAAPLVVDWVVVSVRRPAEAISAAQPVDAAGDSRVVTVSINRKGQAKAWPFLFRILKCALGVRSILSTVALFLPSVLATRMKIRSVRVVGVKCTSTGLAKEQVGSGRRPILRPSDKMCHPHPRALYCLKS
jgi:hypothetical protein